MGIIRSEGRTIRAESESSRMMSFHTVPVADATDIATSLDNRVEPAGTRATPVSVPARSRRSTLVRNGLVVADTIGITIAIAVAALSGGAPGARGEVVLIVLGVSMWIIGANLFGLYTRDERRPDYSSIEDFVPVFNLTTLGTWVAVLLISAGTVSDMPIWPAFVFWLTAPLLVTSARATARAIVRRRPGFVQKTLIVGAGDVGQLVGRKIQQHPEFGMELVGFVDSAPRQMRIDLDDVPLLGGMEDLLGVVRRHEIQRVVLAFTNDSHDTFLDAVHSLRQLSVEIDIVPRLFEAVGPGVGMNAVEGLALVALPTSHPSRMARGAKRLIDVAGASAALIVTAPLLLWVSWRIKRDSSGPVFFRQVRLGKDMKPFTVFKFRTMASDTDDGPHREYLATIMKTEATPLEGNLYKLQREDAVTRVGAWLRRTSLDELPQLFNVLRGEMSLVGPRPCIPYETDLFEATHFDRFLVPAGMTGLWQVEARARSTFKEALDLDAAYARNWSLLLDLWLLARTPVVMLRGMKVTQ